MTDYHSRLGAISFGDHKYAAIFFDWILPLHSYARVPREVVFPRNDLGSPKHDSLLRWLPPDREDQIRLPAGPFGDEAPTERDLQESWRWAIASIAHSPDPSLFEAYRAAWPKWVREENEFILQFHKDSGRAAATFLSDAFFRSGIPAVPVFRNDEQCRCSFANGQQDTLQVVLSGVPLIDTSHSDWAQILELRRNEAAMLKLKRFRAFLRKEYAHKDPEFIKDDLCIRIADYQAACRQHGFEMLTASIAMLVDGKSLITAAGAALAGIAFSELPVTAAVTVALGVSRISLALARRMYKYEVFRDRHELAYVIEARRAVNHKERAQNRTRPPA